MTNVGHRLTPIERKEIISRAASGESLTAIGLHFGVTRQAVRAVLRANGVAGRRTGKLTDAQRNEVVSRFVGGASLSRIAAEFGVTAPSVRGLLLRRGVEIQSVSHGLRHDAFDSFEPDTCYWLGFLFADGCVSYRAGHLPQISVGLAARDREHLVALRNYLGCQNSISPTSPTHGSCQFSVRSQRLADRLIELGRYQQTLDERLVASRDFWRGVVDGDGSLGIYQRPAPSTASLAQLRVVGRRHLLESFVAFLECEGIVGLSVRPHQSIFSVGTTCGPAERIAKLLYEDAGTALARKAEIAARMITRQCGRA
ncbi:helix-turn-helix domain-containing protein [Micromonospora sp. WMMD975]|uniref:helix-turn-helix domain-containing protein n=1 Tax=Micromonospora sp. WMMD975 TaxID=3016087 RepID=UPI00249BBFFF|nr:helix-turn-helix domain-containing protein [Micromonospora sp. WMMD975]WFE32869.1 helix-turn-helix domain-containing protein [Micromonospora sp. WMMD975]